MNGGGKRGESEKGSDLRVKIRGGTVERGYKNSRVVGLVKRIERSKDEEREWEETFREEGISNSELPKESS